VCLERLDLPSLLVQAVDLLLQHALELPQLRHGLAQLLRGRRPRLLLQRLLRLHGRQHRLPVRLGSEHRRLPLLDVTPPLPGERFGVLQQAVVGSNARAARGRLWLGVRTWRLRSAERLQVRQHCRCCPVWAGRSDSAWCRRWAGISVSVAACLLLRCQCCYQAATISRCCARRL
jgi:hypothetical protein